MRRSLGSYQFHGKWAPHCILLVTVSSLLLVCCLQARHWARAQLSDSLWQRAQVWSKTSDEEWSCRIHDRSQSCHRSNCHSHFAWKASVSHESLGRLETRLQSIELVTSCYGILRFLHSAHFSSMQRPSCARQQACRIAWPICTGKALWWFPARCPASVLQSLVQMSHLWTGVIQPVCMSCTYHWVATRPGRPLWIQICQLDRSHFFCMSLLFLFIFKSK